MKQKRNSNPRTSVDRRRTARQPRARRRRPANKGRHYPAEILTADEVRALIRACSNRAPTGVRNRALLVLLYRAGCRISEALRLLPKDLDRAAGTATVLRGKGRRRRTIGLDPGAFAVVERWLDTRTKLGIGGRAPIICTLKGKALATAYVRGLMPRLARRAGIGTWSL
jgi:site-specific recombinase XerD